MSTILFLSHKVPDKKLISEHFYKYVPDAEMKAKIIAELQKQLDSSLDKYIIDLKIEINLKEYDLTYTPPDKNQCYQEYSNTKTGE